MIRIRIRIRMNDIILLFLILCILYYIFFQPSQENYITSIVAYNSVSIPKNEVPSVFETETKELTQIFKDLSKDNDFKIDKYSIQNPYLPFPFNNHLKKFVIDYIKNNVSKFKEDKLEITSDLNDIYWVDKGNDRIFIFNLNLINNTTFMSRNIVVKMLIKDIKKFIKGPNDYSVNEVVDTQNALTNYKTNIPVATMLNSGELLGIKLGKVDIIRSRLIGMDKLDLPYYQIKNILHLMDPFVTSGKDMTITSEMKKTFEKDIQEHQSLLDTLSGKKTA
jgi:hypothetical protein